MPNPATKVGSEFLVNTQTENHQAFPTIAAFRNGGIVVTWEDWSDTGDGSGPSIKAQYFAADGSRVGSEFVVNTQTAGNQIRPTVTELNNGGFVITWTDSSGTLGDSSASSVKAQIFAPDGSKVGSEFLVNTQTANGQNDTAVTGQSNGGFVVTWTDNSGTLGDSSESSVKAQVFDAGGAKVGSEFLVNTQTHGNQYAPSITSLSNGGFVVTWEDDKGTLAEALENEWATDVDTEVMAQVFASDGSKVGSEFLVNSMIYTNQGAPTITSLSNGSFVVAWFDNSELHGDGSEIVAQIFAADGSKIGSEFHVNTLTDDFQGGAKITSLNDGFVVTWRGWDVRAQVFAADGSKIGPELVASLEDQSYPAYDTAITRLSNGGFAITWYELSGTLGDDSDTSIKAQIFASDMVPSIVGDDADNHIVGGAADDRIDAKGGNDTLRGGGGNDTILAGVGDDGIAGGDGDDVINGDDGNDIVFGNAGKDYIDGGGDDDDLRGADGDDTLFGGAGNDKLSGGDGADWLFGGNGNDYLSGGDGDDDLYGAGQNDTINAGAGNDLIDGGSGDDILNGNIGDDIFVGGAGKDIMQGGAGADTFVFKASDSIAGAADQIWGFETGVDAIDLSSFDGLTVDDITFTFQQGFRVAHIDTDGVGGADLEIWIRAGELRYTDFTLS